MKQLTPATAKIRSLRQDDAGGLRFLARWMLRIYFLQHWFNLSGPAAEAALSDSQAMVCHERTDGRRCDAVQEMGLPGSSSGCCMRDSARASATS